jgi:hypothetical protein
MLGDELWPSIAGRVVHRPGLRSAPGPVRVEATLAAPTGDLRHSSVPASGPTLNDMMTTTTTTSPALRDPATAVTAWSRRVRRIGGFIQAAFAGFLLLRGSLSLGAPGGILLAVASGIATIAAIRYGVRHTHLRAPRPIGVGAGDIERAVTTAAAIQLAAAFAVPALLIATGHDSLALPSIVLTVGPLLLWLDHRLDIPRYRGIGWTLIAGPVVLATLISGTALTATIGLAAGTLLLATATAGFRDLTPQHRQLTPARSRLVLAVA